MRSLLHLLIILSMGSLLFLTSCKDDDPVGPEKTDFELLTEYMALNSLDLPDVLSGWVSAGGGLTINETDYSLPDYFIIDLRSATDFAAGHIKDAVNSTLGNVLTTAESSGGKKILVICYTGQTAGRATGALKLMGYDAVCLKWGMSAWHSDFAGKWNNNAGDVASPNWVVGGNPLALQTFGDPTFSTGQADGQAVLESRVQAMLTKSGWGVGKDAVLADPGAYFINNKWPIASWDEYGHIAGAYRIDEDLNLSGLNYLDPSQKILTYCYTGQTSAITNMWLDVLGYDAVSLSFGANGIVHSALLNGASGAAPKKSWKGSGSGSELNFGYYDSTGNYHPPVE